MDEINRTQEFVKNNPSISEALKCLRPGAQLSIVLLSKHSCRLYYKDGQTIFEDQAAIKPDIELNINHEAIRRLGDLSHENLSTLGIEIVREISAKHIQLKVKSSITKIMTGGYLKVAKVAGPEFIQDLAGYGLMNVTKIVSLLKSLRG